MAENKPGRPPKKASEVRSRKIEVRLTDGELSQIESAADGPVSTWVRNVALKASKKRGGK